MLKAPLYEGFFLGSRMVGDLNRGSGYAFWLCEAGRNTQEKHKRSGRSGSGQALLLVPKIFELIVDKM